MKRILIAAIILFSTLVGKASAQMGPYGKDFRPAMWRSSRTATQDNFVLVSSMPIHFHGVVIASPTLNITDSRIIIYNSTSPRPMSVGAATATIISLGGQIYNLALGASGGSGASDLAPREKIQFDLYLSSGLAYDKRGNSDINILWDYVSPKLGVPLPSFEP